MQGDRLLNWRTFDQGADGIARHLLGLGVAQQDKVAIYLYNCPEYLQTAFATMKIGLVPVNTNYRYGDDELTYLWNNADAVAVVFHGVVHRTDRKDPRSPARRTRVALGRRQLRALPRLGHPLRRRPQRPTATTPAPTRTTAPWGRSGDDLIMIYTGGTTGCPRVSCGAKMTFSPASSTAAFANTRSTAGSTGCANRFWPLRARSP